MTTQSPPLEFPLPPIHFPRPNQGSLIIVLAPRYLHHAHTCLVPGDSRRSKVRSYSPWAPPQEVLSGCFPGNVPGDYASSTACGQAFDPHAGAFWEQRYKQRLLDSDIAVLLISPYKGDTWDAYEPAWSTGLDRPFFEALFSLFNGGNTGPVGTLDRGTVFVQGWSAGAQMVSWLIESQFRGHLYTGTTIVGGLFMSGGSHACYSNPPNAIGVCADCDPTCGNEQSRRFLGMAGRGNSRSRRQAPSGRCPISTITPGCSSCNSSGSGVNNTVKPCCGERDCPPTFRLLPCSPMSCDCRLLLPKRLCRAILRRFSGAVASTPPGIPYPDVVVRYQRRPLRGGQLPHHAHPPRSRFDARVRVRGRRAVFLRRAA